MRLEDGTTHFQCAGCNNIRLVDEGHIIKVAYNMFDTDSQKRFFYRPHWVMLCDKCFKGEGENKDD
jgi:hypothetical protein